MLTVTAFWSNDSFRVDDAPPELAAIPPEAFRKAYPEGAAMVEKHIENGGLSEAGTYVFITDENNVLLGYEKVRDL